MNKAALSGVLAVLALLSTNAAAQSRDDLHDSQIWSDTQVNIKLRPELSLVLFGTLRLGRNDTAFVSQQTGGGLSRSFGKHFSSGLFYRFIASEPTPTRRSNEHRVFVDLTPRTALGKGFVVQDRNRLEWRNVSHRASWRYRNRLQFERPFNLWERKLTPYVSGEIYYDTRFRAWNRTQAFVGARFPLSKHVTFDGFYMRQWDAHTRPGFLHVIGAYWRLEF